MLEPATDDDVIRLLDILFRRTYTCRIVAKGVPFSDFFLDPPEDLDCIHRFKQEIDRMIREDPEVPSLRYNWQFEAFGNLHRLSEIESNRTTILFLFSVHRPGTWVYSDSDIPGDISYVSKISRHRRILRGAT